MLILAMLVAWYAVYGAGRQVGRDARTGLASARTRTTQRVAAIRADKKQPKWKRATLTTAIGSGHLLAATGRGARHVGHSVWEGGTQGVAEGRERTRERRELREARPLTDDPAERQTYREVRDRILFDRAERAGRPGVSQRTVRRIARRDDAEDRRTARKIAVDDMRTATREEEWEDASDRFIISQYRDPQHACDGLCRNADDTPDGACPKCAGRGELVWDFGAEHGHTPCSACNPDGRGHKRPRVDRPGEEPSVDLTVTTDATGATCVTGGRYAPMERARTEDAEGNPIRDAHQVTAPDGHQFVSMIGAHAYRGTDGYTVEPVRGVERSHGFQITERNGGTTMTAQITGEVTSIDTARQAWSAFEDRAVELIESANAAEREVQARKAGAAAMLEAAAVVAQDAKDSAAQAETLAASLADADMDAQSVADAQAMQEHAAAQEAAAAEMKAEAEGIQAAASRLEEIVKRLSGLAETSQTHAVSSLSGMNARNARIEQFMRG